MKIGELSKLTGVSRDTIRYYEKLNILKITHNQSDTNNYKDYKENSIERLKSMQDLKESGLTLKEIKIIYDAIENNQLSDELVRNMIHSKLKEIDLKIKRLKKIKISLNTNLKVGRTKRHDYIEERIR